MEDAVWAECRTFILNPGKAIDDARRRLRERMAVSTTVGDRRRVILAALAEKESERERALTAYRRGWASDEETERQLDAISREAGRLREELEALRAQTALVDAQEAYLTESTAMLAKLREELADIEATDDRPRKQAVITRYVRLIEVDTRRIGPRKLEADVRVYLRLKPEPVAVESTTSRRGTRSWSQAPTTAPQRR